MIGVIKCINSQVEAYPIPLVLTLEVQGGQKTWKEIWKNLSDLTTKRGC